MLENMWAFPNLRSEISNLRSTIQNPKLPVPDAALGHTINTEIFNIKDTETLSRQEDKLKLASISKIESEPPAPLLPEEGWPGWREQRAASAVVRHSRTRIEQIWRIYADLYCIFAVPSLRS